MTRNRSYDRRTVLTSAVAVVAGLAGCGGSSDDDYQEGSGDGGGDDADTEEEGGGLELLEDELVVEETDYGSKEVYIRGVVKNNSDSIQDYVQVKARIYNADGQQLDSYMDNTTDLAGGAEWPFEIMVMEDPEEVDDYDISVSDSP